MIVITGKIASGKSYLLNAFKDAGVNTLSADDISHELFHTNELTIQEMFNTTLSGKELRHYVSQRVFLQPRLLKQLESWLQPMTLRIIKEQLTENTVVEVPLYYQAGWYDQSDIVIVVDTSKEKRYARLKERGIMNFEERIKPTEHHMHSKADYLYSGDHDVTEFVSMIVEKYLTKETN